MDESRSRKLNGVLLFCTLLFSPSLLAAGLGLHVAMAERARELLPAGELKNLLSRHQTVYRNGSLFPDIGYYKQEPYAEWTHWAGFLNAYGEKFSQECSYPWSQECEKLLVFYFGSLAHTVGDINFDRHFVAEVGRQDFGGSIDMAQDFTDKALDFVAMKDLAEVHEKIKFSFYLPTQFLLDIYQEAQLPANEKDLRFQSLRIKILYVGIHTFAPKVYDRIAANDLWAIRNYQEARGGYQETSERIAEIWQKVWQKLVATPERNSFPRLYTNGGWPNVDYGIEEDL